MTKHDDNSSDAIKARIFAGGGLKGPHGSHRESREDSAREVLNHYLRGMAVFYKALKHTRP